jgi:hypothetical protein
MRGVHTHAHEKVMLLQFVNFGVGIGTAFGSCGLESLIPIPIPTPKFSGLYFYFRNSWPRLLFGRRPRPGLCSVFPKEGSDVELAIELF